MKETNFKPEIRYHLLMLEDMFPGDSVMTIMRNAIVLKKGSLQGIASFSDRDLAACLKKYHENKVKDKTNFQISQQERGVS